MNCIALKYKLTRKQRALLRITLERNNDRLKTFCEKFEDSFVQQSDQWTGECSFDNCYKFIDSIESFELPLPDKNGDCYTVEATPF